MNFDQTFGNVFKRLRTSNGYSQEDFHTAVTDRYIRMLEKGMASPTLATVDKLAKILGIDPVAMMLLCEVEAAAEIEGVEAVLERIANQVRLYGGFSKPQD